LKPYLLLVVAIAAVIAAFLADPIAQDPAYHEFSDRRAWLGIENFWNVVSNLPFALVGAMGLWSLRQNGRATTLADLRPAYLLFFAGVFLTAFGSAWYHLEPGNESLLWDRLPMTLAFMAFFTIVVGEYVSVPAAMRLFVPLTLAGAGSVFYWSFTEARGVGDLRPYGLVQFLPIILTPLILILYRSAFDRIAFLWGMIALYVIAKGLEYYDYQVYELGPLLSGHSMKHLVAALAPLLFLFGLVHRKHVEKLR
jgi:hypothetical protein